MNLDKLVSDSHRGEVLEEEEKLEGKYVLKVYVAHIAVETELTGKVEFVCPVHGGKDLSNYKIIYKPNLGMQYLEASSVIEYMKSFRKEVMGLEVFCDKLFNAIRDIIDPDSLKVEVSAGIARFNHTVKLEL